MSQAPGWYGDPFLRDRERYFDGHVWTQGVRAAGSVGSDASPDSSHGGAPGTPPAQASPSSVPSSSPLPPWSPPTKPDLAAAPLGAPVVWGAPTAVSPSGVPPAWPSPKRRRRGVVIGTIAAGVLLVGALAGVGAAFVFGQPDKAAATEAVTTAATHTLAAQSADMSMTLKVSVLGHDETISGSGAFDFANQSGTFTVSLPGSSGQQLSEQVLYDGQTVYVNVGSLLGSLGGLGSSVTQGKQWVSIDTSEFGSGSASALGGGIDAFGNPAAMLQQLQSEGGTVTSLGPTTYSGTAVTEYSVALPQSDIEKAMGQLPSSLQHALSGVTPPSIEAKVYVASGNMLKAIDLPLSLSIAGQTMSEDMTMVFSNFGTPVTVTPPPSSEVIPFSQFAGGLLGGSGGGGLGNLGNSGNTGNTGSTGNSGSLGNSGNSGSFGNSGNSGNTGSDSGDTGNTGLLPYSGDSGNTGGGAAI